MAASSSADRAQGISGGFPRRALQLVLGMSAYAYQEGCFVSSGLLTALLARGMSVTTQMKDVDFGKLVREATP